MKSDRRHRSPPDAIRRRGTSGILYTTTLHSAQPVASLPAQTEAESGRVCLTCAVDSDGGRRKCAKVDISFEGK